MDQIDGGDDRNDEKPPPEEEEYLLVQSVDPDHTLNGPVMLAKV